MDTTFRQKKSFGYQKESFALQICCDSLDEQCLADLVACICTGSPIERSKSGRLDTSRGATAVDERRKNIDTVKGVIGHAVLSFLF